MNQDSKTRVSLLRGPTDDDWRLVRQCALCTAGLELHDERHLDRRWRHAILRARHSPIRELRFVFILEDVPYWVAMHLCRHHVGCHPYVRSQRDDRQRGEGEHDRGSARQDAPVDMIWSLNAEALMTVAEKRLCNLASPETRAVVQQMCDIVDWVYQEFEGLLHAPCADCKEMHPCTSEGTSERV